MYMTGVLKPNKPLKTKREKELKPKPSKYSNVPSGCCLHTAEAKNYKSIESTRMLET